MPCAAGLVVALQLASYQLPILLDDSAELHVHDRTRLMLVPAELALEDVESAIAVAAAV